MPIFRLYHLVLAGAALAAYFTAEELGLVHAWLGYGLAGLLLLRLVLGLARRRGFEFRRVAPRLGQAPVNLRGIRHPAIGQTLTLALLLCIAGAATTGLAMDRGGTLVGQSIRNHGDDKSEYRWREDHDQSLSLITRARADEEGEEGREGGDEEGLLGELHETFGNLLLLLVFAHVSWLLLFRFGLARYMIFMPGRRVSR